MKTRLAYFQDKMHLNRFWWFAKNNYLPAIYANLSNAQFELLTAYFDETEKRGLFGECNIPIMSELLGYIDGSNLDKVVQCGHFAGWSTLLLGWALQRMTGGERALYSIDIVPSVTAFAQKWVEVAGLTDVVHLEVGDSGAAGMTLLASGWLQARPKLVFIDSSHTYEGTLKELNLWYPALTNGGLMFLHDVSQYATRFDRSKRGGPMKAMEEFRSGKSETIMLNHFVDEDTPMLGRQDGCGAGIIQKWGADEM